MDTHTSPSEQSKHVSGDFSGNVFLISSGGEILKLPMPSPSPRDPLNWSCKRRAAACACLMAFSAVSMYAIQVTSILYDFVFRIGHAELLLIVIDMTYINERPRHLAMFWAIPSSLTLLSLCLTSVALPHLSSFRGIFLVCTIISASIATLSLFFLRESFFIRPAVAYDGRVLVQSSTEKVKLYEPWQYCEAGGDDLEQERLEVRHKQIPPWMSWMRMPRPFGASWKSMLACYPQVLLCVCNPLIFWVAAMNAINFGGMLFVGSTVSSVLARPPYSLSDQLRGLVNGSAAVGALIAWPLTVSLGTPIVQKLTIRAGGVRYAENYLIFYLLPILAGIASIVLYGLTVAYEWHFSVACLAYGLNSFSNIGMGLANTLWVTEAFPRWAAAALIAVGGVSYMASFGISFTIPSWVHTEGFAKTSIEMGALLLLAGLVAVPATLWGKSLRQAIHGRWSLYEGGALRPHGKRKEEKKVDEEVEW
ncbi:hypothetical protein DL766_009182 [Monosporascus sp. MC13-8B]|uniref:Major facilitator superfamily (MFS) profile domain-containing protein n=1 Tax=Monosporascus cannonballus TaxID=155416 RepID=A0ABY0H403_9PEZI|nr:hypothetical protein DL763_008880 [Monosporascus cannonballus]RYO84248.1 hypothetical protein DL762_005755 [Monosporascus cannonballus]RYP16228.1 hypothetical protein DL766_009182 [Monosporascus sp. MC13-8B]